MNTSRRHLLLAGMMAPAALPAWPRAASAAPDIALPMVWDDRLDPTPYLVSEKYDGVRGVWDGAKLSFRSGRAVPAPAWFTAQLPQGIALDGELWSGRRRFDALSAAVRRREPVDAQWREVRYMVFELPGGDGPFAQRARHLREIVARVGWSQLVAAEQSPLADRAALQRRLESIVAQGGEGLVLHRADAPYLAGRTDAVFKLKPELDAEAVVVAHHPGRGRHAGLLGALELEAANGRRFLVGTGFSDAQRRSPPPIGAVVTYRYRDLTPGGLPRFASFLRVHEAP